MDDKLHVQFEELWNRATLPRQHSTLTLVYRGTPDHEHTERGRYSKPKFPNDEPNSSKLVDFDGHVGLIETSLVSGFRISAFYTSWSRKSVLDYPKQTLKTSHEKARRG